MRIFSIILLITGVPDNNIILTLRDINDNNSLPPELSQMTNNLQNMMGNLTTK